jgi:hypothetical protein
MHQRKSNSVRMFPVNSNNPQLLCFMMCVLVHKFSRLLIVQQGSDDQAKENVARTTTTLHCALPDAKTISDDVDHAERNTQLPEPDSLSKSKMENIPSRQELTENNETASSHPILENNKTGSLNLPSGSSSPKELSVIAEGDELTEQIQQSIMPTAPLPRTENQNSPPRLAQKDLGQDTHPKDDATAMTVSPASPSAHALRAVASDHSVNPSDSQIKPVGDYITSSKVISTNSSALFDPHSMTAPLPSQPHVVQTPLATLKVTFPLHEIPGTGLMRKASAPQLQAVSNNTGATRDSSQSTLGKRTSWLSKAREVKETKAFEVALKRTSTQTQGASAEQLPSAVPTGSGRSKRKSSEISDAGVNEESAPRQNKMLKLVGSSIQSNTSLEDRRFVIEETRPVVVSDEADQGGTLEHLKRAVEGFGARKGKSMGKSLGGTAAAALAEARATAEARVAEKAKMDSDLEPSTLPGEVPMAPSVHNTEVIEPVTVPPTSTNSRDSDKRLSLSELIVARDSLKGQERVFQPPASVPSRHASDTGNNVNVSPDKPSMVTDQVSPQKSRQSKPSLSLLSRPVFMKPPPKVFVAPSQPNATSPETAPTSFGISPSSQNSAPVSAQSSAASIRSDIVFDHNNTRPAWMPTTQETEYSIAIDYETQDQDMRGVTEMEDDDSWHDGDKVGELNHIWTALACAPTEKEDEMTWSTIPTQTHTSSTESQNNNKELHGSPVPATADIAKTAYMDVIIDDERKDNITDDMEIDADLEDVELEPGQMTVSLVEVRLWSLMECIFSLGDMYRTNLAAVQSSTARWWNLVNLYMNVYSSKRLGLLQLF